MKRVVLMAMILAMVLCLFAGCKAAQVEEEAVAGEFVEKEDVGNEPSGNQSQQDQIPSGDQEDEEPSQGDEPADDEPADDEPNPSEPNSGNEDETPDQKEPQQQKPDKDEDTEKDSSEEAVDPDAEGSGWYKILSFNIKSMWYNPETKKTGADMRDETLKIMREIDADIVGLQEVDINNSRSFNVDQPKWLAEQLGYEHYYFTQTVDKGEGDYGHAILSRFPIKDIEEGTYREQRGELRKYTRVILEIDGQEVVYINTHLCTQETRDDGTRDTSMGEAQFREVADIIQKEKRPALMTADYNLPIKTQFKLFDRSKMTSMNGGKTQKKLHDMIGIDNIFVNNMLDYYVDGEGMSVFVGMETSSDHDPLWSYFKIK
ncbi:MAG: endonuclease/exonuclease/phosphatase family protein [Clostridia bacterium]|nr:endonuclease/exonuclease/phosphatase family protein [Clostridia bacterium]